MNHVASDELAAKAARQSEQPIRLAIISLSARNRAVSAPSDSVAAPSPMAKPTALRPISVVEKPRASQRQRNQRIGQAPVQRKTR